MLYYLVTIVGVFLGSLMLFGPQLAVSDRSRDIMSLASLMTFIVFMVVFGLYVEKCTCIVSFTDEAPWKLVEQEDGTTDWERP